MKILKVHYVQPRLPKCIPKCNQHDYQKAVSKMNEKQEQA